MFLRRPLGIDQVVARADLAEYSNTTAKEFMRPLLDILIMHILCPPASTPTILLCSSNAFVRVTPNPLVLADIDTLGLELFPCLRYLCHQFLVGLGDIVEGEHAPAEFEEEV